MANSSLLTLDRVTYTLSDGRTLFSGLSHTFDAPRTGLVGRNGAGKSVLAGQLAPASGRCTVSIAPVYLDQHASVLDADHSVLSQLLRHNPNLAEGEARARLALLGFDTARALMPARHLSGGEQLKAALACMLYAEHPAQLLLLDEPSNHLDLASLRAVENMLNQYEGALLVVSHDEEFLRNLGLSARLYAHPRGWDYTLA